MLIETTLLPGADRQSEPQGRRQFGLLSRFWLTMAVAVVFAVARLADLGPIEIILLLIVALPLWWRYAEMHKESLRRREVDQEPLREEVRGWKKWNEKGR